MYKKIIPGKLQSDRRVRYLYCITCALIGFVLYSNTFSHGYVLDDAAIVNNPLVQKGFSGIKEIFTIDFWQFDNVKLGYYRPLPLASFAIEHHFFGQNSFVSHFNNALLYAVSGFMLCFLLLEIFSRNLVRSFAFLTALLFITHPIHTEVVANLKSRDELLSFLNLIIALIFILKFYGDKKFYLLAVSLVFYYLALLSKETAVTGILIAPLIIYFSGKEKPGKSLLFAIPFLLAFAVFLMQKFMLTGSLTGEVLADKVNYPYTETAFKIPTTISIFLFSVYKLFIPHPLMYDYSFNQIPYADWADLRFAGGLALILFMCYMAWKSWKKHEGYGLAVSFFLVSIIPALGFILIRGGIFAERLLYIPSLGYCMMMVFFLAYISQTDLRKSKQSFSKILKNKWLFTLPLLGIIMAFSFKTIERNKAWENNFTLFSTDVKNAVNSCQAHRHYGSELINRAMNENDEFQKNIRFNEGIKELHTALSIHPSFGEALFKLGVAYQSVNTNFDSAIFYYNKSIEAAPDYALSYNNLGIVYQSLKKYEYASYYYNKAAEVNPYFEDGKRNAETLKASTGFDVKVFPSKPDEGFENEILERSKVKEKDWLYYYNLGTMYAQRGDYNNAIINLKISLEINPESVDAYVNIANCFGMVKDYKLAAEWGQKALQRSPGNKRVLENLLITYNLMGDKKNADLIKEQLEK